MQENLPSKEGKQDDGLLNDALLNMDDTEDLQVKKGSIFHIKFFMYYLKH